LLEWRLEGHPQLPCLPNRLAQDEPKQLALLGPRLFYAQVGSSAREGQQIERCLGWW
jgi:hypothetical protein